MKILLVYYSRDGHTRDVALRLAKILKADIEELIDLQERRGILGYIFAGRDAMKKKLTKLQVVKHDPSKYNIVLLGSPVWGWNLAPAMRTYILQQRDKIKNYAFFVTSGGTDSSKILQYWEEAMGSVPIAHFGLNQVELIDSVVVERKLSNFAETLLK